MTNTPPRPDTQAQADTDDPDRIVRGYVIDRQDEIILSATAAGDVLIEQRDAIGNEPSIIIVRARNVEPFLDLVYDLAGGLPPPYYGIETGENEPTTAGEVEAPPTAPDAPRDRTNAERQRRYRERKRNAHRNAAIVKHRNAQPVTQSPRGHEPRGSEGKAQPEADRA